MTFINYTNDGKAVIQSAALILSGLEREETLELHTLENAIVLLKPEMKPVEKAAAMITLMRLVNSLGADMMTGWGGQEEDENMCGRCHGGDEEMRTIPAEGFGGAGILFDNLRVFSVDGAVLVVPQDDAESWEKLLSQLAPNKQNPSK